MRDWRGPGTCNEMEAVPPAGAYPTFTVLTVTHLKSYTNMCRLNYQSLLLPKIILLLNSAGVDDSADHRRSCPFEAALHHWHQFQLLLTTDEIQEQAFELLLDSTQQKSWRVLNDWWHGRYYINERPSRDNDSLVRLLKSSEVLQEEATRDSDVTYDDSLLYLFVVELVWCQRLQTGKSVSQINVKCSDHQHEKRIVNEITRARSRALRFSAWQMIGHASFLEVSAKQGGSDRNPRVPGNVARQPPPPWMSSTLEACRWLHEKPRSCLRRPFYLWDRHSRMTVETSSLGADLPSYYCISHTWGRWRQTTMEIPGVNWMVPQNAMVRVSSLPEVFAGLEWPVRYVWFDLFCIPQQGGPQQAEEIGKQADIFQQAENMVIWLSDALGFQDLERVVTWSGLLFLHRMNKTDASLNMLTEFTDTLINAESITYDTEGTYGNVFRRKPQVKLTTFGDRWAGHADGDLGPMWFSSLWTLQEAYLCPGAWLADSNWELLSIGNRMLITLDNLSSLVDGPAGNIHFSESIQKPSNVRGFKRTMMKWQLADLHVQNPGFLLRAAESRVATGPRVEAIMSALGCTSWFDRYRSDFIDVSHMLSWTPELVLGMYPVNFLREAHLKLGGAFWFHRLGLPETARDLENEVPLGTLLPLSTSPRAWQFQPKGGDLLEDLSGGSLTEDWEIQLDGTVIITGAFFASEANSGLEKGGLFTVTSAEVGGDHKFESFQSWLDEEYLTPFRVAVAVAYDLDSCYGVILEGKPSQKRNGAPIFVRTGSFQTGIDWYWQFAASKTAVNWLVL